MRYLAQNLLKYHKLILARNVRTVVCCQSNRHFSVINKNREIPENNFFQNVWKKINVFDYSETKLKVAGYILYESIADNLSYNDFFAKYNLPDTFYSWFVVTELHIWILAVRAMAEGKEGRVVRNAMIEAMWTDTQRRSKKLGPVNSSDVRSQIQDLSEQFHAALVGYDEGLLSNDDKILAGALWRRCYQRDCATAQNLEELVKYVRQQVSLFDSISRTDLFVERKVTWPK